MSNFREMYFEGEIDGKGLLDEIDRLRADLEGYMMGAAAEAREVDARGEEIKRLRAEVEENEKAINVWRGRTQRAEDEVETYRKDAERYRWLSSRNGHKNSGVEIYVEDESCGPGQLDVQIDEAMKERAE